MVARGLGMGKWGANASGCETSFRGDGTILELDSGDGCTTL